MAITAIAISAQRCVGDAVVSSSPTQGSHKLRGVERTCETKIACASVVCVCEHTIIYAVSVLQNIAKQRGELID